MNTHAQMLNYQAPINFNHSGLHPLPWLLSRPIRRTVGHKSFLLLIYHDAEIMNCVSVLIAGESKNNGTSNG